MNTILATWLRENYPQFKIEINLEHIYLGTHYPQTTTIDTHKFPIVAIISFNPFTETTIDLNEPDSLDQLQQLINRITKI